MPTIIEPHDFEAAHAQMQDPPIYLNDLKSTTEKDRLAIRDMISSRFTSDVFSLVPSCLCGETKGEPAREMGVKCPSCGQPVRSQVTDAIESHIWIRQPGGCQPLISPLILSMLVTRFQTGGVDVIRYIIDPTYSLKHRKITPLILELPKMFPVRGYNYFVENFDSIIEMLFSNKLFRKPGPKNGKATEPLRVFLFLYRDRVFTRYLPTPNRAVLYIEEEAVAKYMYESTKEAIDILSTIASIDCDFHDQRPEAKANRMGRALLKYAAFYRLYNSGHIGGKRGMLRAQLLVSRAVFASRMVITALSGIHQSDHVHLPWVSMVAMFQHHISAYLTKHGIPGQSTGGLPSSAVQAKIFKASRVYDPDIDAILRMFLESSIDKYGGIPAILSRPPKLLQSSAVRVFVVDYGRDPMDFTAQISARICASLNAKHNWPTYWVTVCLHLSN